MTSSASNQRRRYSGGDASNQRRRCKGGDAHATGNAWADDRRVTAASSRRVDSGSRQTLLVLQFVVEFANIWAQYCPWTYASTDFGFFDLCPNVQMAAV